MLRREEGVSQISGVACGFAACSVWFVKHPRPLVTGKMGDWGQRGKEKVPPAKALATRFPAARPIPFTLDFPAHYCSNEQYDSFEPQTGSGPRLHR